VVNLYVFEREGEHSTKQRRIRNGTPSEGKKGVGRIANTIDIRTSLKGKEGLGSTFGRMREKEAKKRSKDQLRIGMLGDFKTEQLGWTSLIRLSEIEKDRWQLK